jgi:hypothetical protein
VVSRQAIALTIGDNGRNTPVGTLCNIAAVTADASGVFCGFGKSNLYFHKNHLICLNGNL